MILCAKRCTFSTSKFLHQKENSKATVLFLQTKQEQEGINKQVTAAKFLSSFPGILYSNVEFSTFIKCSRL